MGIPTYFRSWKYCLFPPVLGPETAFDICCRLHHKLSTHPMTVKGTQKLKSRELKFILPSNLSKRPRDQKNLTLSVFDGSTCALCDVSSCNVVTSLKLHISAHWIQMGTKTSFAQGDLKFEGFLYRLGFCRIYWREKIFPFNSVKIKKEQNP